MSSNTTNPTSPFRSYATPPTTPSPSNLNTLMNPTAASLPAATSTNPTVPRNPRRTTYNPSRPRPTLRREKSHFGEESELGNMILDSAGFDRIGLVQLGGESGREVLTESQLGEVGVRNGWMVAAVGEDTGSQFTQGSATSQSIDSQASQPIAGIRALNPYQLPSAPTLREGSRQSSSSASPSRPGARRGPIRNGASSSSSGSSPGRLGFGRQPTGMGLGGLLEESEE